MDMMKRRRISTIALHLVAAAAILLCNENLGFAEATGQGKTIATWYDATDLEASLLELRAHAEHFHSLSLSGVGNASSSREEKLRWMNIVQEELKINTYTLVGGDVTSFFTEKERVKTIAKYIDQTRPRQVDTAVLILILNIYLSTRLLLKLIQPFCGLFPKSCTRKGYC